MVNLTYVGLLVSRNLVLLWRVFILWKNVGVFLKLKQIKSKYKSQVPFNLNYLEKPGMSTNFNWRTESVFYPLVCSLHCTLSLYFTPWSAVYIVSSVCILPSGLQSTLYPQSIFYPLVCSPHCTLSLYFTPWSAVHIVPSVCILLPVCNLCFKLTGFA